MKTCATCKAVLPLAEFSPSKRTNDGRKWSCRTCLNARERARYRANPEHSRARAKKRTAAYRKRHPDRIKASNDVHNAKRKLPEIRAERNRKLREKYAKDPSRPIEHAATRRARLRKVQVGKVDRKAIIERDGSRCWICKRILSEHEVTLDHLIPLAAGGPHVAENLSVACRSCNSKRWATGRIPAQLRLVG